MSDGKTGVSPKDGEDENGEEKFEARSEDLTGFTKGGPPWFHSKKVMMVIAASFAGVVLAGVIFSTGNRAKKESGEGKEGYAANVPRDYLRSEYERSLRFRPEEEEAKAGEEETGEVPEEEPLLPPAIPVELAENPRNTNNRVPPPRVPVSPPPPARAPAPPPEAGTPAPYPTYFSSPLVARMEGSLFTVPLSNAAPSPGTGNIPSQNYPASSPYPPSPENTPGVNNSFYNPAGESGIQSGYFLREDILWIGTIIPAVLETAVNTDLPGNVIARTTQNMYDSETGKKLLIPQGTLLVARYNNSVSYAQHRLQIVWDELIRPDGYYLALPGMNGVDSRGMAGVEAEYHENWFEYIKAAGIITLFSLASAKTAEETAKYGSNDMAAGVAASNAEFINQTGGNIVSRAMAIQPTLTVDSGETINIMLNKNMYLPPVKDNPVTQKYSLPR